MSYPSPASPTEAASLWVEALWPWLENDLRYPVRVEERATGWRIEILGGLRVFLARDHGSFWLSVRGADGFKRLHGADLRLRTPLAADHWMACWVWRRAHRTGLDITTLPALLMRVATELRARVTFDTLLKARAEIRAALPLDPSILALAERAHATLNLTLRHYCLVARHRDALLAREREVATLLPIIQIVGHRGDWMYGADYGSASAALSNKDLTPRAWRFLHRHAQQLWLPLRRAHEFGRNPDKVLVAWANAVSAMSHGALPPRRIAIAWAMTFSARALHSDAFAEARLLSAACDHWNRLASDSERRRWVSGELVQVLTHHHARGAHRPKAPPNASWRWYARETDNQRWQETIQNLDSHHPGETDRSHDYEGITFTRLGSRSSLFRAGLQFKNCLFMVPFDYDAAVSPGTYYRLSDTATGRALALLRAKEENGRPVEVLELRGPCNQVVSRQLQGRVTRHLTDPLLSPYSNLDGIPHSKTKTSAPHVNQGVETPMPRKNSWHGLYDPASVYKSTLTDEEARALFHANGRNHPNTRISLLERLHGRMNTPAESSSEKNPTD